MEQALQTVGKIDIYGIYFDFASDRIKPESEPVLREIGKVMSDNPSWTLRVSGHTDNVGGDAYNLDLSKRRAASVKQALVTRYRVAPARLETSGYGASSPKATNKTLEGVPRTGGSSSSRSDRTGHGAKVRGAEGPTGLTGCEGRNVRTSLPPHLTLGLRFP